MDKQYLDLLNSLVSIDSQSNNIDGVNQIQRILGERLSQMGGDVHHFINPLKISGDLLIASFGKKEKPTVTLVAHSDTVQESGGDFRWDKDHLIAPGIADNKGGVLIIIKGIQDFLNKIPNPSFNFQVLISPNEEPGSTGWHNKFRKIGNESPVLLGFEPAMDHGDLISGRRGNLWYRIRVYGTGGHTGREGRESINAAHELSAKIIKIYQLEKLSPDISLHMGSLKTNSNRFNIICEQASTKLDFRFKSFHDRDRLHREIISVLNTPQITLPNGKYCYCLYSIEDDCPPLESNQKSKKIGTFYVNLINNIEKRSFEIRPSGGAADLNYMNTSNSITLDGLGPIGGNLHTPNEFILFNSLLTRSEALTQFLLALNQKENNIWDLLKKS